ncbi:hypothetical protein DMB38_12820 [Streptomyces sp. WAC 06738]|uniref:helix-turn-helix domain-containing protein n=1 Tax=Streptomyces sp. WAC 06738 TaxID=2203210 RepID=UPI000F70EB8A|nr:helix-turn-helix domain-containing protein [Streptomyces sp. WAC 06738]AZM46579.1 hypothetical protein DMB38_12820 [Streptomyces sp. WAC 06738]
MNPKQRPVTDETREQVRQLHAQKLSRNEIARRLQRSGRTISLIAMDLGLSFDRTATEEATRARRADLEDKRVILAEALTDDALRLSAQVHEGGVIYNFGGRDNTYNEKVVNSLPAGDKRALMGAASMAIDRSLRLVPTGSDGGAEEARSMVGQLMTGLAEVYRQQRDQEQPADEGDGDAP